MGGVYAYFLEAIAPASVFDPNFDIAIALMAFMGGLGTLAGPILGATYVNLSGLVNNIFVSLLANGAGLPVADSAGGIDISASGSNLIGGTAPGAGNLISGNWRDAINGVVTVPVNVRAKKTRLDTDALKGFDDI